MKNKKVLMFLWLSMFLLAACSQSEPLPESGRVEIRLHSMAGNLGSTLTRGIITEDYASLTAQVMKTHTQGEYHAAAEGRYVGTMTFVTGEYATFGEPQYYPGDESKAVYLCGLHPSEGWEEPTGTPSETARAIDGCTDIMVAPEVASTRLEAAAGTYKTLLFSHVLTHLVVTGRSGDADAADSWGEITKIEVAEAGGAVPCNRVSVKLADGSAVHSYDAATPAVGMYRPETDNPFVQTAVPPVGNTYTPLAYSLIAPVVAAPDADTWLLKVYTEKRPLGYAVPVRLTTPGSTAGKRYTVALTFKVIDIKAQATVTPWGEGETVEKDVVLE